MGVHLSIEVTKEEEVACLGIRVNVNIFEL